MSPTRRDNVAPLHRPRVVIVIASRHGSTIAIAGAIAQEMSAHGVTAIVCEPDDDVDFDGVDAVIVGSAVYLGRWMRSARRFVQRHGSALRERAVWLFSSGPVSDIPEPGLDRSQLDRLMAQADAIEHREFGGRIDMELLGPMESLIAAGVGVGDGDRRDWAEIRLWARQILSAEALTPHVERALPHQQPPTADQES